MAVVLPAPVGGTTEDARLYLVAGTTTTFSGAQSSATASRVRPRPALNGSASILRPVPSTSSSTPRSSRDAAGADRAPGGGDACCRSLTSACRARAVRRRPVGDAAARRPRRRGDQDRGPGLARRRRPLRAALRRGRGLALLRDVQPQQEERLARPAPSRRRAASSRTSSAVSDAVYSNLRGDQPAKLAAHYDDLKDVNPRIVCCSLSGFGMTGPRAARGRLRLHDAGARRAG